MTIENLFSTLIPSLAFSIALYTFLSNNSNFREFGQKFWNFLIFQLLSMLNCSFLSFVTYFKSTFQDGNYFYIENICSIMEIVLTYATFIFFVSSWLYLCYVFYIIHGSLYHMRKARFLKYIKKTSWIYDKFFHKKTYEKLYRQRNHLSMKCMPNININSIVNGGSILLLYDSNFDCSEYLAKYIIESIENKETVDLITTFKHPLDMLQKISSLVSDEELPTITKKISIIDCFSPHYAFDDKILKMNCEEYKDKGFKFYSAKSFSEIHTATNSSWYRFRKLCTNEENMFRIPHRTVFHTLSSLIRFSSEEQYLLFLRHTITSEKVYGMITLLIEPTELENSIKNELIRTCDIVLNINQKKEIIHLKGITYPS